MFPAGCFQRIPDGGLCIGSSFCAPRKSSAFGTAMLSFTEAGVLEATGSRYGLTAALANL